MKYKVFKEEEKKEETIYFDLQEEDGSIYLVACDSSGKELKDGCLLSIDSNDMIYIFGYAKRVGLKRIVNVSGLPVE